VIEEVGAPADRGDHAGITGGAAAR
jgi:hypothetical protein